jgi:two-component system sensor histidine kinase KdpD
MIDFLTAYAIRLLDALLILLLVLLVIWLPLLVLFLRSRKRQRQQQSLITGQEVRIQELEERAQSLEGEVEYLSQGDRHGASKQTTDALHHFIGHDFMRGLGFILPRTLSALEGIDRGESQEILRDKLQKIVAKAHEMQHHAHNIVELSGLGDETDEQQWEHVRLDAVIQIVMRDLEHYATASGVAVRFKPAGIIDPIWAVRSMVEQILANILDNAIKYSDRGKSVMVKLDLHEKQAGDKEVFIDVMDRGKGIPEDETERIFEMRQRGSGLIEEGSGVGLHYARRLARLLGGDVLLFSSAVNQGSTFRIIFPYPSAAID